MWFYEVTADGWSLDDKRTPLLPESKLGLTPEFGLAPEEQAKNNLPDALSRWWARDTTELARGRTLQSFCVSKDDIGAQGYDLSLNRYREVMHDEMEFRSPLDIITDLEQLEADIARGLGALKAML